MGEEKKQVFSMRGEPVRILPDGTTTTTTTPKTHHPNRTNNHNKQQSISSSGIEHQLGSKFHNNPLPEASGVMLMQAGGGRQSAGQTSSSSSAQMHLGISSISGGEKRDVVSVSQCCNMMETEEVSSRCPATNN